MSNNDDKRNDFFAKFIVCGGAGVVGFGFSSYGLKAYGEASGFEALALPVIGVGLGVMFLRTAWKSAGE